MPKNGGIPLLLLFACGLALAGCVAPAATPVDEGATGAQEVLTSFLGLLAGGQYEQAAAMYAGPLDSLHSFNPELDPQDAAALIGYACGQRLLQCLPVRSISLAEAPAGEDVLFKVEFSLEDGSLFVLGPCCGATSTEMPPVSSFAFRVRPDPAGSYSVLDLPPYVP
ncbi:MAG: hypothetical protein FJZ97_07075 [Chloroflexi bacterium]|nr:hypothetical protein [Chloroflexota bacterium]